MKLPSLSQIWRRVPRKDLCYTLFLSLISAFNFIFIVCFSFIINKSSISQLQLYDFHENCVLGKFVFAVNRVCLELDLPYTHMFVVISYTCTTTPVTPPTTCTEHVNSKHCFNILSNFFPFIIMIFWAFSSFKYYLKWVSVSLTSYILGLWQTKPSITWLFYLMCT